MELFESLINWATMIAVQQSTLGKRDEKKKKKISLFCFHFFFQVTTLNLEVVRALARGTNLVVTIQLLCMFSLNSTYPKKKLFSLNSIFYISAYLPLHQF